MIVSPLGNNSYTTVFGALIKTPPNGTTGEILEADFDDVVATVGSAENLQSDGVYYLGWLSTAPGYTAPTGAIYADASSGGKIGYVATSVAPTAQQVYTVDANSVDIGLNIHIQLLPDKASLYANGFEQWTDSYGMFKKCKQTIDEVVVVKNGEFIVSFGELTIASGKEVTIEDGGTWTIK